MAVSLGVAAMLLAVLLRLMVPAGWMPVSTADGVMITLCSGNGSQQIAVGKHGQPVIPAPVTPANAETPAGPCAFSGLGTPALAAVPAAVALQIFLFVALGVAASPRPRLAVANWLRPPLRGPPLRA